MLTTLEKKKKVHTFKDFIEDHVRIHFNINHNTRVRVTNIGGNMYRVMELSTPRKSYAITMDENKTSNGYNIKLLENQ